MKKFKRNFISFAILGKIILLSVICFSIGNSVLAIEKPRIFVLTDIENEPDDAMSMVRFLVYANQYDIEGLAATTSIHQQKRVAPERIRQIAEAYGKVRDNLEKHEPGFPTGELCFVKNNRRTPGIRYACRWRRQRFTCIRSAYCSC